MPFKKDEKGELIWTPNNPKQALFLSLPAIGEKAIFEALMGGGAGSGKALALDTIIPTPFGYKKLEDIHPGSFVYNLNGETTRVIAESEVFTDHKCYKLKFDSGIEATADAGHKWVVHKNQLNRNKLERYEVLTSEELFNSKDSWSIPVADELDSIIPESLLIDPYTLGAWLGDGNSHGATITSIDPEIINRISESYRIRNYKYNYQFGIYGLAKQLRKLNLIRNKHIPEVYFTCDPEYRLELLKGIMDTDGTISAIGTGIELSLSDEILAKDCLKLIRGLGIKASCSINKSVFNGKNYKERYRIKFSTDKSVFNLKRKADRENLKLKSNNRTRTKWHYITSIEETETVPVKCIQVPGSLFLITDACISTHNSEVLMMYAIAHGWHQSSKFKQLFTRRTYPEIAREIIPRSREMYLPLGAKFFKQDRYWIFPRADQYGSGAEPSGGMIFFGHCEHEDDVHNYDGMEINLWTPDELTSYTEYIYTYIGLQRVRSADETLPAIIRASGMPGDVGHGFVVKRFGLKKYPTGGVILKDHAGNKRIYVHTTASDNKDGDKNYLKRLESIPDLAERNAKKYGDWGTYEGQVFSEFRDKKYPGEPDNAYHIIAPVALPAHWPRLLSIDWGYRAMCSIGWGAVSPDRRLLVYRHQTFFGKKIEEWAPEVKIYISQEEPDDIVVCHSAAQNRGDPLSLAEQMSIALDAPVRVSIRDDRVSGKQLIHEYLRWMPKKQIEDIKTYDHDLAMWLFRNKGELEYKTYLNQFNSNLEQNIPKLLFFDRPDVRIICDTLKQCTYGKPDKDGKKKEDVQTFEGDDPYDMLRMLVHAADHHVSTAADAQKKIEEIEKINKQLENTADVTAYYRNMRRLEALDNPEPIKRFGHNGRRSYHY
jgi:hypothetical protein